MVINPLSLTAPDSLEPYLRADFVHLKECSISIDEFPVPEEVSHNMFTYCSNNPVNMVDADGHFAFLIPLAIEAVPFIAAAAFSAAAFISQEGSIFMAAYGAQAPGIVDTIRGNTDKANDGVKNGNNKKPKKPRSNLVSKANKNFWKAYKKLPKNIQKAADKQFKIFQENSNHPGLNFEKLKGYANTYSVRINDQYRAIGQMKDGVIE